MSDNLFLSMKSASYGLKAQSERLKVITENVANADSTSAVAGGDPYRRKVISFMSVYDKASGSTNVAVDRIEGDRSDFRLVYEPSHPAADARGYVKKPNVNSLIEMADMREAGRSYDANLRMIENSRDMLMKTIEMLRG
jgi:flagellar basal-body rod protein FlgC